MAFQLTESAAVDAVRKNMDEYKGTHNAMLDLTSDDASLDATIKKTLPEAINAVNSTAAAELLEATHTTYTAGTVQSSAPYSRTVTASEHVLRVVGLRASDSPYVVTEVVPENSAEGRKQADPKLCGVWDDPRLVLKNGSDTEFIYYSHKTTGGTITSFGYIVPYHYSAPVSPATENTYAVCEQLREQYINKLTAMTLAILGNGEAATYFDNLTKTQ